MLLGSHSIWVRGSLPPADSGSCEIEMFTPANGGCNSRECESICHQQWASYDYAVGCSHCHGRVVQATGRGDLPSDPRGTEAGRKISCDFINLSNQEALFHMGVQATGYEKVASGHPDHVTAYYMMICSEGVEAEKLDEAFDCLCKEAGEAMVGYKLHPLLSCFGVSE